MHNIYQLRMIWLNDIVAKSSFSINRLSVHELRHTFSTRMYEAGIPSEERARIMGHADSRTTDKIYVTVGTGNIISAMERFEKAMKENKDVNGFASTMTSSLQAE